EHTVRITFGQPSGLFPLYLAYVANGLTERPRHYLEQFHVEYNPDVKKQAEEEGFADWVELFHSKANVWENKELPRLVPWILKNELGAGDRVVVERNPYYFKTDPGGSQLPYIDQVVFDVISEAEVMLLKASNGEIDFHTRHFN